MAEVKVTKRDYFGMIKEIVEGTEVANREDIIAFIDKQVEQIDAKAVKAKAARAKAKEKSDAMRDAVYAVITDEAQTIDAITAQVEVEDMEVTRGKVTARLSALVRDGLVEKEMIKGGSGKITAYKLAGETADEDAE